MFNFQIKLIYSIATILLLTGLVPAQSLSAEAQKGEAIEAFNIHSYNPTSIQLGPEFSLESRDLEQLSQKEISIVATFRQPHPYSCTLLGRSRSSVAPGHAASRQVPGPVSSGNLLDCDNSCLLHTSRAKRRRPNQRRIHARKPS